jgi:hypothetical protein
MIRGISHILITMELGKVTISSNIAVKYLDTMIRGISHILITMELGKVTIKYSIAMKYFDTIIRGISHCIDIIGIRQSNI